MNLGLQTHELTRIVQVLKQWHEIEEAVLFGSRARGNYRRGSDVDLALKGPLVNHDIVLQIYGQLNEGTTMPYFFDVVDYQSIRNAAFLEEIDSAGELIYKKEEAA